MKTILGLLLLPLALFGAGPQPDLDPTHPAMLIGRWQGKSTGQSTDSKLTSVVFDLEANHYGSFRSENGRTSGEFVQGYWVKLGDYLIVDGLKYHIGFVTFKVASVSSSKLIVLNRFGTRLEFTKIEHPHDNFGPPMVGSDK